MQGGGVEAAALHASLGVCRSRLPPRFRCEARDSLKVFQVAGHYGKSVLEGGCSDPHIFDPDRLATRFERSQEVSCTDGFRFAKWQDIDPAQNLACDSFPEACAVRVARSSMTKLGDADRCGYDIACRYLVQLLKERMVGILPDDFGKGVCIEEISQRRLFVRGLRSVLGWCVTRALTISSTAAKKGSSSGSHPRTAPRPFPADGSSGGTRRAIGRPRLVIRMVSRPNATRPRRFESCSLASATLIDCSSVFCIEPFWSRWSIRSRCPTEVLMPHFAASACRRAVASRSSFADIGGL